MKKRPHCGHTWHFQPCICSHPRQLHRLEKDDCMERPCPCLQFRLAKGFIPLAHGQSVEDYLKQLVEEALPHE